MLLGTKKILVGTLDCNHIYACLSAMRVLYTLTYQQAAAQVLLHKSFLATPTQLLIVYPNLCKYSIASLHKIISRLSLEVHAVWKLVSLFQFALFCSWLA